MIFIQFPMAPSEIREPWRACLGTLKNKFQILIFCVQANARIVMPSFFFFFCPFWFCPLPYCFRGCSHRPMELHHVTRCDHVIRCEIDVPDVTSYDGYDQPGVTCYDQMRPGVTRCGRCEQEWPDVARP